MEDSRKRGSISKADKNDESSGTGLLTGITAIVMDIEGTTTPISYVKETVFPFIRENVRVYLEETYDTEQTQSDVEAIRNFATKTGRDVAAAGVGTDRSEVISSVLATVSTLMDSDSKVTPLKQLQGHVWRYALDSGKKLAGLDVYDDVIAACERLKRDGLDLYIFSSGSKEAQKLLFGRSSHGDLLKWFSGHFDTTIGAKGEKESYLKIAGEIKKSAAEILFLTDIPLEASAARAGGMRACLVVRDGNAPLTQEQLNTYPVIHSFNQLFNEAASEEGLTEGRPVAKLPRVEAAEEAGGELAETATAAAGDK